MQNLDNLFEVSWEVCNKVGGINTVIATKASELSNLKNKYILIGPDLVKESTELQNFTEDINLFSEWKQEFIKKGISVRIGRWNIPSQPIAILVDFTSLYSQKDIIFTDLWTDYQLDSLSGRWDYIEPAIFGYASGIVIKSFSDFYHGSAGTIVAHFHEWMSAAGVLFLKKESPNIATVFTTHATILGRVLAGNHLPLYDLLKTVQPSAESARFNIRSRYSLEKTAAANVDVFTTVSSITANECEFLLKKTPDVVTPNGFNLGFLPKSKDFLAKKHNSRNIIIEKSKFVLGYEFESEPFLILSSGRYEFKNKGLDLFIDSLVQLRDLNPQKEILAVIAVPANSGEIHFDVQRRLNGDFSDPNPSFLTHRILGEDHDPVLNALKSKGFGNEKNSKIKVIFAPVYFTGNDGLFNLTYYDFLLGFDLTAFPSYYEPWGYTPMESLAFKIPTITTSLAGFGNWIQDSLKNGNEGAVVIERNENNYLDASLLIAEAIQKYVNADWIKISSDASELSQLALWKNLIENYYDAYKIAVHRAKERIENIEIEYFVEKGSPFIEQLSSSPKWKKTFIAPRIPEILQPLVVLSKNLWWTWNFEAAYIFKSINPLRWKELHFNPIELIESLSIEEIANLESNNDFVRQLQYVYSKFNDYMAAAQNSSENKIAYFSMEYGLHDTVKIFSGGLGILAGDYLKEASDKNVNLVSVGLLYRYGYFKQRITPDGTQLAESRAQKFTHMPVEPMLDADGIWKMVEIALPGRLLKAKIWKVSVGRIPLYLLDTDIDENNPSDRAITHHLYGGGIENRLLQEILLGVGGVRALEILGEKPSIFHLNEGHAAMAGLERLFVLKRKYNLSFPVALELVRTSSLFTTHTPVPAGHDRFEEDLMRRFIPHYADRLGLSWNDFMGLGRENVTDFRQTFSMSVLALKLSQGMNGVSKIHGEVSRNMFVNLFPGYFSKELYIGHVTNGVHWPTWTAKSWQKFFSEYINSNFVSQQNDFNLWQKIYNVPNDVIWEKRQLERSRLVNYLKARLQNQIDDGSTNPNDLVRIIDSLNDKALTIGFARRFATYKRAHLLFTDLQRLAKIVGNKKKPVQFIFAGKAHPADKAGQDLIKRIVEISRMPEFEGKIIFIPDYDIDLGKKLTQGVDVWLNNPTRPLEASGTSGEKAVMNGVLNLSVLDGWWAEGYVDGAGWALKEERTYEDQGLQDQLDAAYIYQLIENEVRATFYNRNDQNVPEEWVGMIKKNFAEIAPHFTMNRMVEDYVNLFYEPLLERTQLLNNDDFKMAHEIVNWKNQISEQWNNIEVSKIIYPDSSKKPLKAGDAFKIEVWLENTKEIKDYVKVEVVTVKKQGDDIEEFVAKFPLEFMDIQGSCVRYGTNITMQKAGVVNFALRVYAWNENLPHRQDFILVEWI